MTTLAEPTQQVRPPEPRSARDVLVPLLAFTLAVGVIGFAGEAGPVWGILIALITFGLFAWVGLSRSLLDAIVMAIAGAIGFSIFNLVIASRDPGIDNGIALLASLGVALFGLAPGWVTYRHSPGLKPTTILISAATWGGGAYLALLTAGAMQLLAPIQEGVLQELTFL